MKLGFGREAGRKVKAGWDGIRMEESSSYVRNGQWRLGQLQDWIKSVIAREDKLQT